MNGRNSDNTLIKKVFGWEPSITLRDGMEKTYALDPRRDGRPARAPAAARGRLGGPVSDGRGEVPFFRPDIGQKEIEEVVAALDIGAG